MQINQNMALLAEMKKIKNQEPNINITKPIIQQNYFLHLRNCTLHGSNICGEFMWWYGPLQLIPAKISERDVIDNFKPLGQPKKNKNKIKDV